MTTALKSIELITGVNISLSPVGPEADTAATRFVKLFGQVWGQLPSTARVALVSVWKMTPATVFLTQKWTGQDDRLAQCAGQNIFHFHSSAFSYMPDNVNAVCIAHELAHAFFFATNDPHHRGGLDKNFYDKPLQYRLAEALARELCNAWGFNSHLLTQWCADNEAWLKANIGAKKT